MNKRYVFRGGSWINDDNITQDFLRGRNHPYFKNYPVGIRIVRKKWDNNNMHGANIFIHIPSTKTNTFTLKYVTNNNFTEMYSDMKKIIGKINETTEEIKVIVDRNNIIRIIENVLGKENYL